MALGVVREVNVSRVWTLPDLLAEGGGEEKA